MLFALATGLLTLGFTGAVSAAGTTATVTVTGGALSITVPVNAGNLGTTADTVLGSTVTGLLGPVQVNDARSAAAGSLATPACAAVTAISGPLRDWSM